METPVQVLTTERSQVDDNLRVQNVRVISTLQVIFLVLSLIAQSPVYSPFMLGLDRLSGFAFIAVYYIFPVAALLITILTIGYFLDKYSRKKVLLVCEGLIFLCWGPPTLLILMGAPLQSYLGWILVISGTLGRNVALALVVVLQTVAADATDTRNRARVFGLLLGLSGGNLVWQFILTYGVAVIHIDYSPVLVALIGFTAAFYLTWAKFHDIYVPRRESDQSGLKRQIGSTLKAIIRPQTLILFALLAGQILVFTLFTQNISLLKLSRTGQWFGLQELVPTIVIVVVQLALIGRLSRWLGDRRLVYWGLLVFLIGIMLLVLVPTQAVPGYSKKEMTNLASIRDYDHPDGQFTSVPLPDDQNNGWGALVWFYSATVITSVGIGILTPPIFSLLTQQTDSWQWGKILSIGYVLVNLIPGFIPRPTLKLTRLDDPAQPYMVAGLILALLVVLAVFMLRPPKVQPAIAAL